MPESKQLPRLRDADKIAKLVADLAASDAGDRIMTDDGRDLAAVLLGRRGGLKGGNARAKALSSERRSEIASLAARKRWNRERTDD